MLRMQQEVILKCFNTVVNNLSQKVDSIMCDVQDSRTSINLVSTEQEKNLEKINNEITIIKKEVKNEILLNVNDRNLIKQHKEKLIDLEDQSRKNNLQINV